MFGAAGRLKFGVQSLHVLYITQGIDPGPFDVIGYNEPSLSGGGANIGSIQPLKVNGVRIVRLYYVDASDNDLHFNIQGTYAQNWFTSIQPQNASVFTSASANDFTNSGGVSRWIWRDVPKPSIWDGSGLVWCKLRME